MLLLISLSLADSSKLKVHLVNVQGGGRLSSQLSHDPMDVPPQDKILIYYRVHTTSIAIKNRAIQNRDLIALFYSCLRRKCWRFECASTDEDGVFTMNHQGQKQL